MNNIKNDQQQVVFRQSSNENGSYQQQMSYQDANTKIYDVISDGSVSVFFFFFI